MCEGKRGLLKTIKILLLLFLSFFCVVAFAGCEGESVKKSKAYLSQSGIERAEFDYDSASNKTRVVWVCNLKNQTIYDIEGFSVTFNVGGGEETYSYDTYVRHGKNKTTNCQFFVDGEVSSMQYVSWSAEYSSIWDTYKIWIFVTVGLAFLFAVIYIIVMIVEDLDLEDISETVFYILFGIFFIGGGFGAILSSWVSSLIVLGGVLAFIVIALLAHGIKCIVEFCNI